MFTHGCLRKYRCFSTFWLLRLLLLGATILLSHLSEPILCLIWAWGRKWSGPEWHFFLRVYVFLSVTGSVASNSLNLFSNLPVFVNQKSTTCNSEQTTYIFMIHIWDSRLFSFSLCELTHVSSQETKRFLLTSVYLSCSCSRGWLPIPWRCTQDPPKQNESDHLKHTLQVWWKSSQFFSCDAATKSVRNLISFS